MKKILYFAYASNLKQELFEERLGRTAEYKGVGILPKYGFRFNHPMEDGSARANIVSSPNEHVYGAIYEISEEDLQHFLKSEPGYKYQQVDIHTNKGKIQAGTFLSPENQPNIFPSETYLASIIEGGKQFKLPNDYLENIVNRSGARIF
ncbi:gamma-glutamylcyclotransferase [Litoribacter ruber]|uniref:gamma-glutamylcyclotransferase family protein n=1 Tax=Litoribacter ruber TaxID=702568 RepID=UPI001BDAA2A5|nr:gamma-glutamylcyclotransferase family protein [Litoribacter ruber]MBT0812535.1 gamma-glutamylcyclotransferase [Litoribacter ruber]